MTDTTDTTQETAPDPQAERLAAMEQAAAAGDRETLRALAEDYAKAVATPPPPQPARLDPAQGIGLILKSNRSDQENRALAADALARKQSREELAAAAQEDGASRAAARINRAREATGGGELTLSTTSPLDAEVAEQLARIGVRR
jgi:hypothetical protein